MQTSTQNEFRLTVLIPTRNDLDFVVRAISSAQAIPIEPMEIVVVDDGSSDGTAELLQTLAAADRRIVVISRDRDHGAADARNEGIAKAHGDIVCFLDADDALHPEMIGRRVVWHEAHLEIVLSFTNYETLLPYGAVESRFTGYCPRFEKFIADKHGMIDLGDAGFGLLFGENPVCTTGVMARRGALMALGGFDRELRQAEDWDLWIRLARHGSVAYSTSIEATHTAREGSLSTNVVERTQYIAKVVRRHCGFALRQDPFAALSALSSVEIAKAENARLDHRNVKACVHYFSGLALRPNRRLARDFARSVAVLLGLRSGDVESFDERGRRVAPRNDPSL